MWALALRFGGCLVLAGLAAATAAGTVRAQGQAPPRSQPGAQAAAAPVPQVVAGPNADAAEKEIAGLPRGSAPVVLTWDRVYALVLVRARSTNRALAPSVDLDALTRDAARFGVADFARYRQQFLKTDVTRDPGPNVLALLGKRQAIATAQRQSRTIESLRKLVQEQVQAASSGLNRVDLDAVIAASVRAGERLDRRTREFRDGLDELKVVLGLSPRAAVILDRVLIAEFEAVFDDAERWSRAPNRRLDELYKILATLPLVGDVVLEGQPVLQSIAVNPDRLEELLARAADLARETRSDGRFRAQENIGVSLELKIRRRFRLLADTSRAYNQAARTYELAFRLKDQSFERLFVPTPEHPASRSASLLQLLAHVDQVADAEERLVDLWTTFRAERLRLYKDLGLLPDADWASYLADLTARRTAAAKPN